MKQGPIIAFIIFIAVCAGVAHALGVDLYAVVNAVSSALSNSKGN